MKVTVEDAESEKKPVKKLEFSKIVLGSVITLYFVIAGFAAVVTWSNPEHIGELLAYIGAPTATAIGFYAWKARSENIVKITRDVEQDKKMSRKTKEQLVRGFAKVISDIETEDINNGI